MPEIALKKGWARVTFGDVVKLSGERSSKDEFERFVGLEHIDPGDLKIRRWGYITNGTTFTSVFRPGQVLFGKRRAYQRKIAVADFSGVCSGDIYVLEPRSVHLLSELLPFICQTDRFFEHAVGTSAGSLSPRTNWKSLANYEFALPPLEEQRRIVQTLSAAEDLLEATRAMLGPARVLTTAVIDRLISGNLSDLPIGFTSGLKVEEWQRTILGNLCSLGGGHGFRPQDWADQGLPIIRIQNVRGSREFNFFAGEPDPAWLVEPGELLFSWAGVPGVSFGPGIWEGPRAVLNQHIFRVTPQAGVELPWLYEVLRHLTPRIERRAHGFKHSLLHIKKADFTSLRVLLPPVAQQLRICNHIRALRAAESTIEQRFDYVLRIKGDLLALSVGQRQ